ncbi:Dynein light chain 1, cytoplasmic [Glycine soja]
MEAVVRETDIPEGMQSYAMELAHQALDAHEVSDCQSIAHFIKQSLDCIMWTCLEFRGWKNFGSCTTHLYGSFIFFRVEMMEFLIFRDKKDFTKSREEAIGVLQKARNCDS